ncbi:predicted protein [Plenodomus lingam JN3]|uniref:Predicted protein n=1 Tax=Leptosphaeria maculans (strain JN3 / isolate v23.1.3 / race Av1-4-5-6-7-8) TaxID=985895 RepID=E5AFK2_LEPMJ|nr:predicted protein [Plenodomus lingam JN3]CBY01991.1 predicted protein [Plenodomus lingam JN3]
MPDSPCLCILKSWIMPIEIKNTLYIRKYHFSLRTLSTPSQHQSGKIFSWKSCILSIVGLSIFKRGFAGAI